MTIRDLAETVREVTDTTVPLTYEGRPPDDPDRRQPDITKAREVLSWSPDVSLESGLRQTVDWYRTNFVSKY